MWCWNVPDILCKHPNLQWTLSLNCLLQGIWKLLRSIFGQACHKNIKEIVHLDSYNILSSFELGHLWFDCTQRSQSASSNFCRVPLALCLLFAESECWFKGKALFTSYVIDQISYPFVFKLDCVREKKYGNINGKVEVQL